MLRATLAGALLLLFPGPPARAVPPAAQPTPLLSVRRDPAWLQRQLAAERLAAAIAPLTAGTPQMCVDVSGGGSSLYQLNADAELVPASNMKVLTATALLDRLGADFRSTTEVESTAEPAGGTLTGDLYLVGGGDPDLMTEAHHDAVAPVEPVFTDLDQLAESVRAAGITTVTGSVVGDSRRFDGLTAVPTWLPQYQQEGDVGPLSALEVDDSNHGAMVFTSVLAAHGVKVTGPPRTGAIPARARTLASAQSNPLSAELEQMLRVSDDTAAELFVKQLGYREQHLGTTAAGEEVVRRDLSADGLDVSQLVGVDGSGLDTGDRATCSLVLAALERAGDTGIIAQGLPVAARSGTLTHRLAGTPAAGRLHAKTGTLDDVAALSGFIDPSAAGIRAGLADPVWFSIIINGVPNATAVAAVDRIAVALASYPSVVPISDLEPTS